LDELALRLRALKPELHNTTDLTDRDRLIRAIEIAAYAQTHAPEPAPELRPLILGVRWPRPVLRARIHERLAHRLDHGLVEEVERLHESGASWDKLEFLGLEYRFVARFLRGEIRNLNDLRQKLDSAIAQFARRQESWFRRMERHGTAIHWLDRADLEAAAHAIGPDPG
ncbi:MAG: tRNA (adenosine(37)-N6)-dimethylallyltransferase MiaA, partial [Candidatus Hydrogenedentes bacterium]|nr:tRNA (adenosine(37)-N6)-dimethylallyltransferase MiaA [Candidatus Hydrogenedentota bacterium]